MSTLAQFGKKKFFSTLDQIRDEMAFMNLLHERLLKKPVIVTEHDQVVAQLSITLFRIEQYLKEIEVMAQREPDKERTK